MTSAVYSNPQLQGPTFEYVSFQDEFLSLFPHRYDFIYAELPVPGESPSWFTESRYPLSDRLIQQHSLLYGVRFGSTTHYAMVDIDVGSLYHPDRDPFALTRLIAAFEPLGITDVVRCTSSYRGGLHLYLPLDQSYKSWQLAAVLTEVLKAAGFSVTPGQLEIFPNLKPYTPHRPQTLFNAHRLPLQIGSYLLNQDCQPIWSDSAAFVQQWRSAQQQNIIDPQIFQRFLKQSQTTYRKISGKVDKFLNDLNTEIESGWTGPGQTNYLLGRIAMREYIFHHVLYGGDPLTGDRLTDVIVQVATALPGYRDWCRHQHEIGDRAAEWARCIEASKYFHYGTGSSKSQPSLNQSCELTSSISWNQQQSDQARDRIRSAIADLLDRNALPVSVTARFQALTAYGIGGSSLYKHRDLWHPQEFHLQQVSPSDQLSESDDPSMPVVDPVENSASELVSSIDQSLDCAEGASNDLSNSSLLPENGRKKAPSNSLSGLSDLSALSASSSLDPIHPDRNPPPSQSDRFPSDPKQPQAEAHRDRMRRYFTSDDPILRAEAIAWIHSRAAQARDRPG